MRVVAILLSAAILAGCGSNVTSKKPSSSGPSSSAVASPSASPTLPGTDVDGPPRRGDLLTVVGVRAGQSLLARRGPGTEFAESFALGYGQTAVAVGENRLGRDAVWTQITVGDQVGWANGAFLLQAGATTDITTQWYPTPAVLPSAPTLPQLAETVASKVEATGEPRSRVSIVDGPHTSDVADITVDVLGLGDDAIGGYRLRVLADHQPQRFTVRSVKRTLLCSRGVATDGSCL